MCSYNKVGTIWACESGTLITDILKNELDFQGWVVSGKSHSPTSPWWDLRLILLPDWGAQHTAVGSANAGMVFNSTT
jgi:beta-glucosidase